MKLGPGKYRIEAYLRGVHIEVGQWKSTTLFDFNGKRRNMEKSGAHGWTPVRYVFESKKLEEILFGFGLRSSGKLWLDDVSLTRAPANTPVTRGNITWGEEESPIKPPTDVHAGSADAVRCPERRFWNSKRSNTCYACGASLRGRRAVARARIGPKAKLIASLDQRNPFDGGVVTDQHAADGRRSLRIDKNWVKLY